MTNINNNESGRSMIEMLGVLAIIGVLSVGGIAGYSKAMAKYRINKAVDQISQIATNFHTFFGGQKNYADLTPKVIVKARLIPDEMTPSGTTPTALADFKPTSPYGDVVFEVTNKVKAGVGANDSKAFVIKFSSVPEEACLEMAVMDWASIAGSGLIAYSINDTEKAKGILTTSNASACTANTGKALACPLIPGKTHITPSDAATACAAGDTNELAWKFY